MSVSVSPGLTLPEADLELGVSVRSAFSCHSLSLTCGASVVSGHMCVYCQIAQFENSVSVRFYSGKLLI